MNKIIFSLVICTILSGCEKPAQESKQIGQFKVERLFNVDNCEVYRFWDARQVYFVKCNSDSVSTSYRESCGKSCSRQVDVPTVPVK